MAAIHVRLGTRKSALAQAQARWVAEQLRASCPGLSVEFVLITTTGDLSDASARIPEVNPLPVDGLQRRPASRGGLKSLFTKEIEEALLDNRIDLAVHSLKDMAAEIPRGLLLAAVPAREDPRDVWISKRKGSFQDLSLGATVATSAIRRQAQVRHQHPAVEFVALRGNVDTRLKKLEICEWDGMILALAGLKRLGREAVATEILSLDVMLPAIGQGALAIEARAGDTAVLEVVKSIDDPDSHLAVRAERAFLKTLGGSCQTPIAAYAQVSGDLLTLQGLVVDPSGNPYLKASEAGSANNPEAIGQYLATALLGRGADKILK